MQYFYQELILPKSCTESKQRKKGGDRMAEIHGTFDAERFFNTLAMLISQREHAKVTVTVKKTDKKDKNQKTA